MSRISTSAIDTVATTAEAIIGMKRAAEAAGSTMLRRAGQIMAIAGGVIARIGRDGRLRRLGADALSKIDDHTLRDIGFDRVETLYAVRFKRTRPCGLPCTGAAALAWELKSPALLRRLASVILLTVTVTGCQTGPVSQGELDGGVGVDLTADLQTPPVAKPNQPTPVSHPALQSAHLPNQHEKQVGPQAAGTADNGGETASGRGALGNGGHHGDSHGGHGGNHGGK